MNILCKYSQHGMFVTLMLICEMENKNKRNSLKSGRFCINKITDGGDPMSLGNGSVKLGQLQISSAAKVRKSNNISKFYGKKTGDRN